ncbi:uncharacterized protein LOC120676182 isoform X3 [Panicum virgatum]|uniref:uncharacterized protein LOC120663797 isoform X3 n=1 Tax=Panicum virgatum TaxID=38727 RepID=UPI0019D5102C|nr:uncharacterized protein LOC120663797 isoform X3 [Panicum virgatum]XP_039810022.1 uncharacterized protein LOC120673310 isoform X3 [Panicum virgatum]XP_039813254.1 uncharacterized protein LOC120676094 isoform X3 [Panicum virgatum]XP_039813349.1 uncharacterized protein LOC120676182 isoform X3 [Panicum virgatum]
MDPQLPAIRSRLFSPLHENNEKSVQVSAAMVCPKFYWILDARWEKLGKEGWNKGASCISESSGGKNNKIGLLPKKPARRSLSQFKNLIISLLGHVLFGGTLVFALSGKKI